MLPVITAQNLFMLRDGTGKPFTQFMDSVLRASAARLGIRPGEVHTSLKTSVSDGGVDSQVDRGGDDPGARLLLPTMWQYKARRFGEISDAIIEDEILGPSKEYARELIRKRHAYRLCICDDAPSRDKLARQQELNRIVQQVFPTAAPALVLLASELAEWANHYPSTVAQLFGLPTEMFRYFESWRPSAIGDTPNFVASEHYRDFCAIVNAHLDWSQKPDEVALTVFGDAGIGKTRSVFEALNGEANQRELVIYTVDEEAAVGLQSHSRMKVIAKQSSSPTNVCLRQDSVFRIFCVALKGASGSSRSTMRKNEVGPSLRNYKFFAIGAGNPESTRCQLRLSCSRASPKIFRNRRGISTVRYRHVHARFKYHGIRKFVVRFDRRSFVLRVSVFR